MEVKCPSCKEPLYAKDINISTGIGACHKCNRIIQFKGTNGAIQKPVLGAVKKITTYREGMDLIVERSWKSGALFALVPFTLIWNAFLIFWYSMVFKTNNVPWIAVIFPIGHVAVGLGLIYFLAAGFLNKTKFRISRGHLDVKHTPVPWPGNKIISTNDIAQLYVQEKTIRNKGNTSFSYTLMVNLKNNQKIALAQSISDYDQARKLEQEIEAALGIADTPIPEEKRS